MVADMKMGDGTSTEGEVGAFRHGRLSDDEVASLGVDREKRKGCKHENEKKVGRIWFWRLRGGGT